MTTNITSASLKGRELYHTAWAVVGQRFYDVERLRDWASWEHKFDELIDGEEAARRYIGEMLASLHDSYTRLLEPVEVVEREEARTDTEESNVLVKRVMGNIGYVRIFSFSQRNIVEQVADAMATIADCDGFIVDLRDNGGGLLNQMANCCELFVATGGVVSIEYRLKDGRLKRRDIGFNSEAFIVVQNITGEAEEVDLYQRRTCVTTGKPVAVLINGGTASAAESLAAAILENGRESGLAVAIGEETHGKGIGQDEVEISETLSIKVSDMRFFSPSGIWFGDARQTTCNAIRPDIKVQDIEEPGVHPVLEVARDWLRARVRQPA